jgi:hypothetical protein
MSNLEINNLDSPLINLKIDKVSNFDKVMRLMVEIHFGGLKNEEYQRSIFFFGRLGSWRKSIVKIILVGRSTTHIHLGFGQNCLSVEVIQ